MLWVHSILFFMLFAGQGGNQVQPQESTGAQVDKLFEAWNKTTSPGCALSVMEEPAAKLTEAQLTGKVGIYYNPDGDVVRRIILQGGSLRMLQGVAGIGVELKALSDTRFRPVGQAVEIRFEPVGAGGMRWIDVPDSGAKPVAYERTEEFKPTPAQLEDYVGQYQSDEIEPIYRMAIRDGRLVLERMKSGPSPLAPAIKDLFINPLGNIRFLRDAQGRVTGFILNRARIINFRFKKASGNIR